MIKGGAVPGSGIRGRVVIRVISLLIAAGTVAGWVWVALIIVKFSWFIVTPGAIGLALLVLVIQRWLAAPPRAWSAPSAVRALCRLGLALVLGALAAVPLAFGVFQSQLNTRVGAINEQTVKTVTNAGAAQHAAEQIAQAKADIAKLEPVVA